MFPPFTFNSALGVAEPTPTFPFMKNAELVAFENVAVPVKAFALTPDCVYGQLVAIPVVVMAPPLVTWNCEAVPTAKRSAGTLVPTPVLPATISPLAGAVFNPA